MTKEESRLEKARERKTHWKRWGPYLSERAWGTVREDYSAYGTAWDYLPHELARSKAYRWNEDGIGGISDRRQFICFALAMWNGKDPLLKERLFGLTGSQGNHGEDVKEYYYYLDSTPTHSYMKYLYKYPQAEFPYRQLVEENQHRDRQHFEYELMDTGVFDGDRYFDVFVEYAKATPEDVLIRLTLVNRGAQAAKLEMLPTIWFRNTWSWGGDAEKPSLRRSEDAKNASVVQLCHPYYGHRWLFCQGAPELLFTENNTNPARLERKLRPGYFKDGINDYIVHGSQGAVNPALTGTKAAAHYALTLQAGETRVIKLRLTDLEIRPENGDPCGEEFDQIFVERQNEADEFYATVIPETLSDDEKNVMRQAFGGLMWSKQFYFYDVRTWLQGDPTQPPPPPQRSDGRNHEWKHLYNDDIISMPDKWEYPWYAAWDLAFHCIPIAMIDPDFAKDQLILLLREWYMHPNGQLPAYEWAFSDVNPPVHAWAALRVYKIEQKRRGRGDVKFLERVFHKLLLNFNWWINRKDAEGNNVFEGGFLGLDNIGVFDRSKPLPTGGILEQADGTSWMAMYCLNMLAIAMELSRVNPAYEDVASKFWEHFLYIAYAINNLGKDGKSIWNEEDGFYYDLLRFPDGSSFPLKIRSMVGLIPLFAVETLEPEVMNKLQGFKRRMDWFIENREDLTSNVACMRTTGRKERRLLAVVDEERLRRVLKFMLDENEFLSPHGIRALSRYHHDHPYKLRVDGTEYMVDYEPAESSTGLFGGNSNWRGPVWFPVNYLIIEALQKFHHYLGTDFTVECPTGSGQMMTLWEVAAEISRRLNSLFLRDENGRRPVNGGIEKFQTDPHWRDYILFYEYFHGDNGAGIGASHQTGWTALVAKLLQQSENKTGIRDEDPEPKIRKPEVKGRTEMLRESIPV
ncbi:MAG: glucosidase [Acidobacteria bacterium]|nr:glucosidase [Acidobacteriota bacterium]